MPVNLSLNTPQQQAVVLAYVVSPQDGDFDGLLGQLAEPQQQRACTLRHRRRKQFILGRWVLLQLCDAFDGVTNLKEIEDGAPALEVDGRRFYCSVSHCRSELGHVAIGVISPTPIGVDIETIKAGWTTEKAALFCTKTELAAAAVLTDARQQDEYYTRCWTRKEALSKYHHRSVWDPATLSSSLDDDDNLQSLTLPVDGIVGAVYGLNGAKLKLAALSLPMD